MLSANLQTHLPTLLDVTYNQLRPDIPGVYSEFFAQGDARIARSLAELIVRSLELSVDVADRELLATLIVDFNQGEYLSVIDKYMPELPVRWSVMKSYFDEARANAIADHHNDMIDDDDRDFNLRNKLSHQGWDYLRKSINEAVHSRGIVPRIEV